MKGKRTGLAVKNPDNAHFSRSLAARETISETSNISTRWQPYLRMLAGIKRVRKLLHTNKTSKRSPPFPSFVFTMIVPFCDRGTKRTVINLNRQIYAHCAYLLYRHVVIAGRGQLEDFKETVTACLDNERLSSLLASVETFRYCKAIEIDREWGRQQIAELQSIPGFYDTWEKYDDDNAHATRKVTKPLFPNLTKASLNILKDVSWLSHDFERRWASRKPHRVLNEGCFLTNIEELIIDKLSGPSIASIARLPAISYLIDFTGLDLGNLSTVCIMTEEKDDTLVFTIYQRGPERRRTVTEESD